MNTYGVHVAPIENTNTTCVVVHACHFLFSSESIKHNHTKLMISFEKTKHFIAALIVTLYVYYCQSEWVLATNFGIEI